MMWQHLPPVVFVCSGVVVALELYTTPVTAAGICLRMRQVLTHTRIPIYTYKYVYKNMCRVVCCCFRLNTSARTTLTTLFCCRLAATVFLAPHTYSTRFELHSAHTYTHTHTDIPTQTNPPIEPAKQHDILTAPSNRVLCLCSSSIRSPIH